MRTPCDRRSFADRAGWTRWGNLGGVGWGCSHGAGVASCWSSASPPSSMVGMGTLRRVRRRWMRGAARTTVGSVGLAAVLWLGEVSSVPGALTLGGAAGATLGGRAPATLGCWLSMMAVSFSSAAMCCNFWVAVLGVAMSAACRSSCAARRVRSASDNVGTLQWAG